jgi:hypothetical protein
MESDGQGMSDWQPIDTAPKDGTWMLLRGESGYIGRPYLAHVGRWMQTDDRGGWWEQSEDAYFADSNSMQPTHWMPLP